MRSLLLAVLAAYVVAAIHAVLAFINKRRALQRVSELALLIGFLLHTGALAADWIIDGHYPLFFLRETLSFLAWTLVASYLLILYRYRARPLGTFILPQSRIRKQPERRIPLQCETPGCFRSTRPCYFLRMRRSLSFSCPASCTF